MCTFFMHRHKLKRKGMTGCSTHFKIHVIKEDNIAQESWHGETVHANKFVGTKQQSTSLF